MQCYRFFLNTSFLLPCLLTALLYSPASSIASSNENQLKALYINYWAASSKKYKKNLFKLINATSINAVVIDIKNEFGELAYISDINLAHAIGAHRKAFIKDHISFLAPFKERNLYTIARLSIFKDHLLAKQRPEWAIKSSDKKLWYDLQGLAWTDPFVDEVQEYNLQIAMDVMNMGFDEIHFDYIRFPSVNGLHFIKENTLRNRVDAISNFLETNRTHILSSTVKVSVATYGYSCWNSNDTYIGHQVKELASLVDYVSPMLYPSSFQRGIPGYRNPVNNPYEIVLYTLKQCAKKSGYPPVKFRPWLQAFRDYGFDKRVFGAHEIKQQIKATVDANASGWMLWNPASHYPIRDVFETDLQQ